MRDDADTGRAGSAALDLASVAAGRLDAYFELNLKPWDIAAGIVLVQEAGGTVTELYGQADPLVTGHILAASHKLHGTMDDMLKAVRPMKAAAAARD